MNAGQECDFACAIIIDTRGRFLLQERDDVVGISFPGMIGLFGGDREGDETFLQCVVREVHEEISYFIPPERFERLTNCKNAGKDDATVEVGAARSEYYVVRDVPVEAITVTEGSLFIAEMREIPLLENRLAPPAQEALRRFLDRQSRA
jgi:8-oxo-dGTP diphosphatase